MEKGGHGLAGGMLPWADGHSNCLSLRAAEEIPPPPTLDADARTWI